MVNTNNKSTAYSTNSYEAYVPTPMSSSQQYITSEFSNIVPPTNSSLIMNENTLPVNLVGQIGITLISKIVIFLNVCLKVFIKMDNDV